MESSPYFQLVGPNDACHVVPPGMSTHVRVRFTPDENKDYSHELVCISGTEWIVVPIRATSTHPTLDFPDQLDFSRCPVKCSTHRTLLVHNTGDGAAHYQLSTQSPFSVVPATGTLGAGDTMQVTVGFHPLTTGDHSGSLVVCCTGEESTHINLQGEAADVNIEMNTNFVKVEKTFITKSNHTTMLIRNRSRESRLALQLRGEGQGPLVELSSDTLDLGCIFVNTPHVREVKLINQGAIDAPFTYIPSAANVGYCFKFSPKEGLIAPGGIQTIQISFNATVLGWFEEQFQFSVAGSPTPAILTIKGRVTGPTLHFDIDELDFGDISFGFPYTKTCRLTNTSPVPVTFRLRMSDDGTQPAVSSFDQIRSDSDPAWRKGIHFYVEPREFTMNPSQGTILPQEHQDIEVTLCSNTVMEFYRKMLVDLEWFAEGVISLIIKARCFVPELQVYPRVLCISEFYLKVPSVKKLFVRNNTHLPGCYSLIPQECKEDSPVLYSSPRPCGIVQPQSTAEIPLTVEIQTLGKHCTSVSIGVFGDERNPLRAVLRSFERLSEIYPSLRLIDFGMIPAMKPNSQSFTLFNERLVDADFRLKILFIGNSLWTTLYLQAFGTGSTIVVDKPFAPELNLGYQFSLLPCIRRFKLTNRGHHFHRLFWKVECDRPAGKEGQSTSALSSPKAEDDSQSPKCTTPVFELEPLSMDLMPGESVDMVLRGFSHQPQVVQNCVICEAVVGTGGMTKIMETTISCKFIDPSIEISARQFSFRVEKKPNDVLTLQYQPLAIKNTCSLPLDLMLDLEQPFLVCTADQQPLPHGQPVTVDVGRTRHLCIAFDPACRLDFNSWKEKKVLKIEMVRGHPYVECITLCGEAHFPSLQIQPSTLEFGCIVGGIKQESSLEMTNNSTVPVEYDWSLQMDDHVKKLRHELYPPKVKPQPPSEKRTCLDKPETRWRRFRIRNVEEPAIALEESRDLAQSSGAEVLPHAREKCYMPPRLGGFRHSLNIPHAPLKVEKAFSILPMSGVLQPGETQQVSFTFFGRLNTVAGVRALCHVEGGPTYKVELTRGASHVSYLLSSREIDCGLQTFNEIHNSRVTLQNTCEIKFSWVLNPSPADQDLPGVFLVKPTRGSIAPGEKQELSFSCMPGLPGAFSRTYHLQVGDLDQINICLKGEASFPMITVNLPWNIKGNEKYKKALEQLVKPLQQHSQRSKSVGGKKIQSPKTETLKSQAPATQTQKTQTLKSQNRRPCLLGSGNVSDTWLQLEMMRMLIEKAALEAQKKLTSHLPKSRFPDNHLCQSLVNIELPEYVLDMGSVLKGCTERRTLEITNPGQMFVSFQMDVSVLQDTGFSLYPNQMEDLPPTCTMTIGVFFESACCPKADMDVLLPIKVAKGPTSHIRLHATVVELSLSLSKNTLQFSDTLVGQCQTETVRLYNWFPVPCSWFITAVQPVRKDSQHKCLHQKLQALKDESHPFKVTPSKGTLDAGSWQNLEFQFTPREERSYKNKMRLNICESSNCIKLHLSGQGLEPRLKFIPPALKMGWVLVDSDGVEATVVVKNPCNFPIEFYSLDFDEQYLEEEKILRMAVGSEYQKNFLMPPRAVGETLPPELLEYYEAQKRPKAQQAELKAMAEAEAMGKAEPAHHRGVPFFPEAMVKATGNPISQAVMRHLGTDQSSERREARQDKGIVVIVHGPPQAGKKPQLTAQTKNKQASGEEINKNAKGKNPPAQKKKEPASKPKFTVSTAPAPQQLNITSSCGEELNCLSCVLPEDLLVEILCERLKHEDCYKGVVFDGLESLFASSLESSLLSVLKAVRNRRYIFMVNVHQDYASWKVKEEAERQRQEAQRQKEELQREEALQRKRERALQRDEEEYDALPEEEKAAVDKIILESNRRQREREQKQLPQKLEEEPEALGDKEWRKKEKKGVSLGKQPAKPEKGKTKPPERKETIILEKREPKSPEKWETKAPEQEEAEIPEDPAVMEKNLLLRFQIYESSQQNVAQVFSYWDRVQGSMQLPVIQNGNNSQPSAENKGQKTSKPQEKIEKKPEQKRGDRKSLQSSQLKTQIQVPAEEAVRDKHVGVPCLDIKVTDPKAMFMEILRSGRLPTDDEMLRHLGLHPDGPPLPPAVVLSVVNYPEERLGSAEHVELFTIEAPERAAVEDDLAKAPDVKGSSAEGQPKMGKAASRDNSPKENQISTQRTERPQDTFTTRPKSTLKNASTPTEFLRLKQYRWIVPAHGEVELKVHFSTQKPGKFEQTLRFELVGTKCQYELPCSATALYPSISQDPRLVFPRWRETMEADEIIFKEYVKSTKQFHFGPLLCGKSKEWYKAQNCPNNSENITIVNNSPMDAEVQFFFEKYEDAETFLFDPPSMTLKPEEKQELTIWAYPTSPGFLEAKLICCIEKNPDPVVFSLCCHGVHMKLEVSPLELSFDKMRLHRTGSRTLVLKNDTLLPMAWQLNGLDDLVEDFSLSQDKGTVDPCSELEVTLNFKAGQIGSIEKTLQLEVSDTENILGIVQAENIKISAEVYDLPLSIDMPEGPDGSLEFGTINVLDKVKKVLSLKNKGMYNIEYSFTLKGAGPRMRNLASHFTVEPQSGMLTASQPAVDIEMLFHPTSEILLKNKPILYCQVMDGSSGKGGQTVTNIPVRVSARAVYSKYSIEPASPIDFGAMLKGTKKTQTVVLENKGMVNFKFCIHQAPEDASALESQSSKQGESAPSAAKRSTGRKSSSLTQGPLSLGMFTVSPCSGSISPCGQQKITVECLAGQEGICEEQLYIDITGRDPRDNPRGIPFILIAESCLPALVEDVMSIFEEYPICSSNDLGHNLQPVKGVGLFISDKNKFIFNKVLVRQKAEAHFHIYNASSLPCDVVLSIQPLPGKDKSPINVFKLYPVKMSVPGSSYAVATMTFTPPDKKNYNCTFKASLVIPKGSVKIKPQILTFTISGKGYKPHVTVVCPSSRSNRENSVLRFKRLQLGESEMLPLVICNKGRIPIKFMLHLEDEHGAFFLKGRDSTLERFYTEDVEEDSAKNESKTPFLLLHSGQSTKFDVIFKPTLAQRLEARIYVLGKGKYFKKSQIKLVGEGHEDEFTLDGLEEDTQERNAKSSLKKDVIDAVRVNHIQFGNCSVRKPSDRTFTITNHSCTKVMRFEWEAKAPFRFSPKVGHLHPGCAKGITVTLKSDVPATFRRHPVKCKVTKINFELSGGEVQDWDDQMWKDTSRTDPAASWPEKEKVVERVPEPAHTVVEESSQEAEVYLSASVVYSQFKLSTNLVQFKDTLPFQTRKATFRMHNTGKVALEYSWEEAADNRAVKDPHSTPLMRQFLSSATLSHDKKLLHHFSWQQEHPFQTHPSEPQQLAKQQQDSEQQKDSKQQQQDSEQQDSSKKLRGSKQEQLSVQHVSSSLEISLDVHDLPLFSISPHHGTIAPGKKQTFHVLFSPKSVGKFMTTMLCRIPSLEPTQKKVWVIVKGRAQEQKSLGKPKRSALQQAEKGQRPKKQVRRNLPPE
ncbi:hydrocephalus-inducing protein homolog [Sylvia borin]